MYQKSSNFHTTKMDEAIHMDRIIGYDYWIWICFPKSGVCCAAFLAEAFLFLLTCPGSEKVLFGKKTYFWIRFFEKC